MNGPRHVSETARMLISIAESRFGQGGGQYLVEVSVMFCMIKNLGAPLKAVARSIRAVHGAFPNLPFLKERATLSEGWTAEVDKRYSSNFIRLHASIPQKCQLQLPRAHDSLDIAPTSYHEDWTSNTHDILARILHHCIYERDVTFCMVGINNKENASLLLVHVNHTPIPPSIANFNTVDDIERNLIHDSQSMPTYHDPAYTPSRITSDLKVKVKVKVSIVST